MRLLEQLPLLCEPGECLMIPREHGDKARLDFGKPFARTGEIAAFPIDDGLREECHVHDDLVAGAARFDVPDPRARMLHRCGRAQRAFWHS